MTARDRDLALYHRRQAALADDDHERANAIAWELAMCYQALARRIAAKIPAVGLDIEDRTTEALIGIHHAAEIWQPDRGTMMTLASWWGRARVTTAIERGGRTVRLPRHTITLAQQAAHVQHAMGGRATASEIAEVLHVSERAVNIARASAVVESLDAPAMRDEQMPRLAHLPDPRPRPDHMTQVSHDLAAVRAVVATLPPRQREAITLVRGLDGREPISGPAAGRVMGLSRERVRQLVRDATITIRAELAHEEAA